jgi:hypothetical protein
MHAKHLALSYAFDVLRVFSHTGERRGPPFRCQRCESLTNGQAPVGEVCKGKMDVPKEEYVE